MATTAESTNLNSADLQKRVERFHAARENILAQVRNVIVGQDEVLDQILTALFVGGHCLITGLPGTAKTLMVRTIAQTLGLVFKRIQFTPDLMPSDITGTDIIEEDPTTGHRRWTFVHGPIFANILLADEVNRTPPKTQSALLEAMQELSCTVRGNNYLLPSPFFVLATQNPIELEGTYPLPEAQMDRFIFKVVMGSPKPDELREILNRTTGTTQSKIQPIFEPVRAPAAIENLKALVREVMVAEPLERYIIGVIGGCTPGGPGAIPEVSQYLRFGPSPRGAQALILCAKVNALLAGRVSVSYDDIDDAIVPCLRHRLLLNFQAEAESVSSESILEQVIKRLKKPRT
jgi:MoxR-like ATPase